jgi:hypothetical protein
MTKTRKSMCRETLETVGRDWLIDKLEEVSNLSPRQIEIAATQILTNEYLQESIEHHADKVIERGYNEGRLEARCEFMIDDWGGVGWDGSLGDIRETVKAVVESEGGIFTDEMSAEEPEEAAEEAV